MSDEQLDRAEEEERAEDVEAHGFAPVDAPIDAPIDATEEPPDVEGHHMGRPIDPRPVDSPVD